MAHFLGVDTGGTYTLTGGNRGTQSNLTGEFSGDHIFLTDELDGGIGGQFPKSKQRARDRRRGRVVSAHRVESDARHGTVSLLGLRSPAFPHKIRIRRTPCASDASRRTWGTPES